jgi:hypothetical protein
MGQILMECVIEFMPLEATLNHTFLFSTVGNTNVVAGSSEMEAALTLTLQSLIWGLQMMYGNRYFRNIQLLL